jgi:hypothetical protein
VTTPEPGLPVGARFLVRGVPEPIRCTTRPEGRTGGVRHSWPADYPERARALRADGLSCSMIGAKLSSVPFNTVKDWLYKRAPV